MKRRSKAGKQETSFVTSHNSSNKSRKTDVKDDSGANVVREIDGRRLQQERYFTVISVIQALDIS